MPASQPIKNPTLVPFARGDSSIKIAAMIGTGLMAMPIANGRISPITSFMRCPQELSLSSLAGPPRSPARHHAHKITSPSTFLNHFGRLSRPAPILAARGPSAPLLPCDGDPETLLCWDEVVGVCRARAVRR